MTNKAKYDTKNPLKRALLKRFLDRTRRIVDSPGVRSVLDVGTGEGLFWLHDAGREVVGVDVRMDALREAASHGVVRPVRGSAYELPFDDSSFDLVVAIEILEHLESPERAAAELSRVSRSRVLVTVPWEPWFSLGVLLGTGQHWRRLGREPEHINAFGPHDIEAVLSPWFGSVTVATCAPWIVVEASEPRGRQGTPHHPERQDVSADGGPS